MAQHRAVIVGAGVGGLVSAALLARRGVDVEVLERAPRVGGKMREVVASGRSVDSGPTVLTMRWVFEEIFEALGERLDDHLTLHRAERLARHAWSDGGVLDLFADPARSADAIGALAGPEDARGYLRFCEHARRVFEAVDRPFLRGPRPGVRAALSAMLDREAPLRMSLGSILAIDGHRVMSKVLGDFFRDPRLVQLFGRYATYAGSSPFLSPATLNVIAHVEREGVWLVEGGMYRVAEALLAIAEKLGARFRTGAHVREILVDRGRASGVVIEGGERLHADAVIVNGDAEALGRGLLGPRAARGGAIPKRRSLSAITWSGVAEAKGFPLVRHTVFFSKDYAREFEELFDRGRVPTEPTVYVCAQDRDDEGRLGGASDGERLLVLINAPPIGDQPGRLDPENEAHACEKRTRSLLETMGLSLDLRSMVPTTPRDFERMFPGSGGALYGPASHGMTSAFDRSDARTRLPGLYLAGGSAHPGAGVPMVAMSGRHAARASIEDLGSISRSRTAATPGGISMS
jgi:1-hydroxycarotenoid 3,4-desaturase